MEDAIQRKLVQELLAFYHNHYYASVHDDAEFEFWDDFFPEDYLKGMDLEIAMQNFFEWIVFDFFIDENSTKTLIDYYLKRNKDLSPAQRKVLKMMNSSPISLYEVQDVFPEKGLLLKDLILGGEFDVREKTATRSLNKWDIFACRLLKLDGKYIMSGAVYPYHLKFKERILDDIHAEYEDYKQEYPGITMNKFLKHNGDIFNFYWYDPIQNPMPVNFVNTNGDPLLMSEAIFEINDMDGVLNGLAALKEFERDVDGYMWHDNRKKDGSATILGKIIIKNDRLTLATNSRERLGRGKELLLTAMPHALAHKMDSFQDPMAAMDSHKDKPCGMESEIPFEVQQELYTKVMQDHSEQWLNTKVPALNGKTPMQAVRTADGKKRVIELLKLFENAEARNSQQGRPTYDLSWMWERLGLERQ